jgi:hypothetical protein
VAGRLVTSPLGRLVRDHFGIEIERITALDVVAHNQHYVATAPGGPFHLTLHDLPEGSTEIEELEEVDGIVARLEGPTAALASTIQRGVSGRYLEPTALGHLTVRHHRGRVAGPSLPAEELVAVARAHSRVLVAAVPPDARLRVGAPRFAAPGDTLDAVAAAGDTRLSAWMTAEQRAAFGRAVEDVRRSSVVDGNAPLRPVHGDLEPFNLVVVHDGTVQVIDHDCMHWDHALFDLAHLMVSSVGGGYFCGPLDRQRADSFLAAVRAAEPEIVPQLLETCCYVLLEKLTAVDRRRHLLAERRLATIAELRALAQAGSAAGHGYHLIS